MAVTLDDVAQIAAANNLLLQALLGQLTQNTPDDIAAQSEITDLISIQEGGVIKAAALVHAPTGSVNAITWANNGSLTDGYVEVCQHAAAANPDGSALTFACVKADGTPINLDGKGARMVVYGEHPNSSTMWQWSTNGEGLTISATSSHNIVELLADNTHTGVAGSYRYSIWDSTSPTTANVPVARGQLRILSERASTS